VEVLAGGKRERRRMERRDRERRKRGG